MGMHDADDDALDDDAEDDDAKRRFPMTEGELCPADPDPVTGRCDALIAEIVDADVKEWSGVDRPAIARGFTRFKRIGGRPIPEPPADKEKEMPLPRSLLFGLKRSRFAKAAPAPTRARPSPAVTSRTGCAGPR